MDRARRRRERGLIVVDLAQFSYLVSSFSLFSSSFSSLLSSLSSFAISSYIRKRADGLTWYFFFPLNRYSEILDFHSVDGLAADATDVDVDAVADADLGLVEGVLEDQI